MAMSRSKKVKVLQMAIGADLIGSKMSMVKRKDNDLEVTPIGIAMYSETSKRTVIIPFSNVKAFELMPEEETQVEAPKEKAKK